MNALLQALPDNLEVILSADQRMDVQGFVGDGHQVKYVKPTLISRFMAETWLARSVTSKDILLCLGNLPPLFKLRGRTIVFVQNRYLIEDLKLDEFHIRVRLRLMLERMWFIGRLKNIDELVVQTPAMKVLIEKKTGSCIPVHLIPFVFRAGGYQRRIPLSAVNSMCEFDFVYVASGEPHKNHRNLLEAWRLLGEQNLFPTLCLTLNAARFEKLCQEVEIYNQQCGIRVTNAGEMSHTDIFSLYKKSGALIFPSKVEAFGLPLIEARQAGLPVLAPELDYVRDLLDPEQTFDADSPVSIARAVKRFLGKEEQPLGILDASEFIKKIVALDGCKR